LARRGDPDALARKILENIGYLHTYRQRPRLHFAQLLQHFGLTWHRRDLAGLAAALVRVDGRYYVVTDKRQGWARQRFTAAHELKHYLTDRHLADVFYCRRTSDRGIERATKVFARELLMPAETVRWLWERGFYAPEEIGRVLGVSFQAARLRMAELELGRERVRWREWGETM